MIFIPGEGKVSRTTGIKSYVHYESHTPLGGTVGVSIWEMLSPLVSWQGSWHTVVRGKRTDHSDPLAFYQYFSLALLKYKLS